MFDDKDLLQQAGSVVFARGVQYVQHVQDLDIRETSAAATIIGSSRYAVRLSWKQHFVDGSCTCPHWDRGNFCKHLVAVGIAVLDRTTVPGAPPTEAPKPTEVDADALLTRLATALPRGYVDYRRADVVAHNLQRVLDEVQAVVDAGRAEVAVPVLEKALARMPRINADDSNGVIGDACQRAADLHADACAAADIDQRKLGRWLAKFRLSSPGWPQTSLEMYAAALGEAGLKSYRAAVAKVDKPSFELERMRLELADHDGDLDEIVRQLAATRYGPSYAAIIDRLEAADRVDDALMWLDRAVAVPKLDRLDGRPNEVWVPPSEAVRLYVAAGRADDALGVARQVFSSDLSPQTYRFLIRTAERLGRVEEQRQWAVDHAEQRAARADGAVLVLIALADKDLVAAWSAAERFGAGRAWKQLADASATDMPVSAAELYRPELERQLFHSMPDAYVQVVAILKAMRALYAKVGEEATIDALITELRERYKRRTSLIARLDKANLRGL